MTVARQPSDVNDFAKLSRLAIIATHPTQYNAPWFQWIARQALFRLKVFYLWDFGVKRRYDPGFSQSIQWDLPLLDGYDYEFVPNLSRNPGTERFGGIYNPSLSSRLQDYAPDAALLIGYRYRSFFQVIFDRDRKFPLLFRGDSHRLASSPRTIVRRLRAAAISHIYNKFAAFLYVGRANHDYFREHGVAESKLFFSPHAVDNARFNAELDRSYAEARRWKAELGIPADHLVIMFAGKFERKKRPLDLLEAFELLRPEATSLLFVGAGELEQELRARATRNVYFAPFQNQSQMPRTYAAADLFVLPSVGPQESWGLAINEALCLGVPVVISSHVGCGPDLVKNGRNGLVFRAGDVAALKAALSEALRDPARLRKWGAAGREIVEAYNFQSATAGLIEALQMLDRQLLTTSPER